MVFFPLLLPWALWCCLRRLPELARAWQYFFVYNRQGVVAPGVLKSPAGGQPVRVWYYRLMVFLVAATTLDGIAWPNIERLGPGELLAVLCLAAVVYTPGLLIVAVASLVIGPSLKALQEDRRG